MRGLFDLLDPLGRLLAASLFLGSGYDHVANWTKSLDLVAARGLPLPALCLGIAVVVEATGAIALILGWRTRIAAFALAGFALVATSLFHADFNTESEAHLFAKDLALAGALLCLAARPPGRFSLDLKRST
jgi:putative oxidoreductase